MTNEQKAVAKALADEARIRRDIAAHKAAFAKVCREHHEWSDVLEARLRDAVRARMAAEVEAQREARQ